MGNMTGPAQRSAGPNFAPALAYVPMADGSSSEAPVISPNPMERNTPRRVGSDTLFSINLAPFLGLLRADLSLSDRFYFGLMLQLGGKTDYRRFGRPCKIQALPVVIARL